MGLEADDEEDDVGVGGLRQGDGVDLRSDRCRVGGEAVGVAGGGDGHMDAVAGKRTGRAWPMLPNPMIAWLMVLLLAVSQIWARPPSTDTSLAVMKLLSSEARNAATAPTSAGSAMRCSGLASANTF